MSEATQDQTPLDPYEGWPIGALEPVIFDLRATVGIFGHLINSPSDVDKDEWGKVENDLLVLTRRIGELWRQAWDQHRAETGAHEAALAALEAKKAAPGSPRRYQDRRGHLDAAARRCGGRCQSVRGSRPSAHRMAAGRGGTVMKKPLPRPPSEAANDLIVLGEILQMFDQCEDINGTVVGWLGDQVAAAADEVFSALMIAPAPKLPEPGEGGQ
jgi:hypothetical protein